MNNGLYSESLISVVLPCHNSSGTIVQTLTSVLRQTYKEIEVLVVDDCSTDNTVSIVKELMDSDDRIKLVQLESNQGAGASRNEALRLACGRYIAFLDSDDVWMPTKLECQLKNMRDNEAAICHTSYTFIDELGRDIPGKVLVSSELDLASYLKNTEIGMSTAVVDRNKTGYFELKLARTRQDAMLWIDLLSKGVKVSGLNVILVKYRKRSGQISGNKLKMLSRTFLVYIGIHELSLIKRLYYFSAYAVNAVKKRL